MGLSKRKAIYHKCLECSGDSWMEVLLCHLFDCPLWEYRTGDHIKSKRYKQRITAIFSKDNEAIRELRAMGLNMADFLLKGPKSRDLAKNSNQKEEMAREISK